MTIYQLSIFIENRRLRQGYGDRSTFYVRDFGMDYKIITFLLLDIAREASIIIDVIQNTGNGIVSYCNRALKVVYGLSKQIDRIRHICVDRQAH